MARSRDEYLGCEACRTVLFRLKAVRGDNHSVFQTVREALTEHQDHEACGTCKAPLVRMHKAGWE